nr:MAG TPA: hypothetical protein [Caudoviricetes sp.]
MRRKITMREIRAEITMREVWRKITNSLRKLHFHIGKRREQRLGDMKG